MSYFYSSICSLALISMFTVGGKAKEDSSLHTADAYSKKNEYASFVGTASASSGTKHSPQALNIAMNDDVTPDIILSNGQRYRVHPFQQQISKEWKEGEKVVLSKSEDTHPIKLIHLSTGKEIRAKSVN